MFGGSSDGWGGFDFRILFALVVVKALLRFDHDFGRSLRHVFRFRSLVALISLASVLTTISEVADG